ncbi:MAG TPA: ABC transporter substrate-binding protein [Planctomycetota bacterium]
MRIISLQPTSTEMAFALGAGRSVVGVSHECVWPPAARKRPVVSTSIIDPDRMSSAEIDREVAEAGRKGESLYRVDAEAVERLKPDLLLTQTLCEVCAATPMDVAGVVDRLGTKVVALHAHDFPGMFRDLRLVAEAVGKDPRPLEKALKKRLEAVARAVKGARRRRVFCMEWMDPVYAAGHWVPEMVERAGGVDGLAAPGGKSRRIPWPELLAYDPEVLILMPCGLHLERVKKDLHKVAGRGLKAETWFVDGPSYFNGAGPRLIDGVVILAGILHPERMGTRRRGLPRSTACRLNV